MSKVVDTWLCPILFCKLFGSTPEAASKAAWARRKKRAGF